MIPNATTPPRHRLKISIPTRRTAGPLLLAVKGGATRLGQLAGRVVVARKVLLALLPLQIAPKAAAREAVKEAVKVVDKAAARVAIKVEEQPLQLPPPQLPRSLALPVPATNPTKMTAMITVNCDFGNPSSPAFL